MIVDKLQDWKGRVQGGMVAFLVCERDPSQVWNIDPYHTTGRVVLKNTAGESFSHASIGEMQKCWAGYEVYTFPNAKAAIQWLFQG